MIFKIQSVRTRMILLGVTLSTATASLLGTYLVWTSYRSLRSQAQDGQLALARSLAAHVDEGVSQAFQAVAVLAQRPDVTRMEKASLLQELSLVTSATELLDSLLVVLPDGKIFAQSRPGINHDKLPLPHLFIQDLAKIKQLKGSVYTDIYETRSGEPAVAIRAPIIRDGEFSGILVGVLYLAAHGIGNIENGRIGKTGFAYIISEDGVALVHPDRKRLLKDLSDNPAVQEALHKKEGIIHFHNQDGQEILAAFAKAESAGWGVVVRQPAAECYEPALSMLKFMSLFLVLALLLGAVTAAWAARRMAEPVIALTEQVRRIEEGGFDPESLARLGLREEFGLLARALANLSTGLAQQRTKREEAHRRALAAERKLSEAERLASVGQLAAGLAHELNNPLTVIQGAAQVIPASKGNVLVGWAREIVKETKRCKRLISDLLNFSRPIKLELRAASLKDLCQEAWSQSVTGRRNKVKLTLPAADLKCMIDSERLKQVMINLFSNSVDAMKGKGRVKVRWQRGMKAISLEMEDDGPGLGPDDPEKFFRPFFTTKPSGTGLGLSIARAILRAHGGNLWAKIGDGRGATMAMKWPIRPTANTEKELGREHGSRRKNPRN